MTRSTKLIAIYVMSFTIICGLQFIATGQTISVSYQDSTFKKYADTSPGSYNYTKPYYIASWTNLPPAGTGIIRQLDDNTAIVNINSSSVYASLKTRMLIAAAKPDWKLSPPMEKLRHSSKDEWQKLILTGIEINTLLEALKQVRGINTLAINRTTHSVIVKCRLKKTIEHLLQLNEIIFIDAVAEAHAEIDIIGYDRSFHGQNALDYFIQDANGKNIVAGVKENKMNELDIDLWKRVLPSPIESNTKSDHATVIASIIGGAGNNSYYGKGVAWGCKFFPSSFTNLFADDIDILNSFRVSVQNHSYGTVIQQFYGAEATSYDVVTWLNKSFVPVISAGNEGQSFASEGKYANLPGYANLTGSFKMAKNVIIVGAIDNKENIIQQSSSGPVYDGRLAPHIVALGSNGTSDAAALVTGTVAVMQQVYADSNDQVLPEASLIKSILYNTTDDIYRQGIDYKSGYGSLNSYAAVRAIKQKNYAGGILSQGQLWTQEILVPENIYQLKVTLAWTDSAATINNNKALINDLDLELIDATTGTVYHPWVLSMSPNTDSLSKLSTRSKDSTNTAEQVSIQLPTAGTYQVRVKGSAVRSAIPFHLAYNADTLNTFMFTSPQHTSDIDISENEILVIRWKTFVSDSNEIGNLYISYNFGTTWQLISESVKLKGYKHDWQINDTNSVAMFRMETSFGIFHSNTFVISTHTRPQIDFNCDDSVRLSWSKYIYADGYQIFSLMDSPYFKPLIVVADTFIVLQRSAHPSLLYAVQPILSNIPAARSRAIDVDGQGVKCFYKTLNYNLLDDNKLKIFLELSNTDYVDSIFFENVTGGGQLIQTYASVKTNNTDLLYNTLLNEFAAGVTYIRARIKLLSGVSVYTNIVSVLSSGKRNIMFYPNPVSRLTSLKYVLKQGLPADSQLQFFDMYGRLVKNYSFLPDQINISLFHPGMLIYRLVNRRNGEVETGKLLVQ